MLGQQREREREREREKTALKQLMLKREDRLNPNILGIYKIKTNYFL
jgi:hypothetical protein